jgi:hypothetical protein
LVTRENIMRFQRAVPAFSLSVLLAAGSVAVAAPPAPALPGPALLQPVAAVMNEKPAEPDAEPVAPTNPAPADGANFSIDVQIPSVATVNSSMSDQELTRVFAGDFAGEADKLATLNAASIRVPEIKVNMTVPPRGEEPGGTVVYEYKNLDIEGVSNGVAKSATVGMVKGSVTGNGKDHHTVNFELGQISADDLDIGGLLGFYGYGPGATGTTMKQLYRNLKLEGGAFTAPDGRCTLGTLSSQSFSARPLTMSFGDLMKLISSADMQQDKPSPETITRIVMFYADFFSAVQSSPATLADLDCSGTDEDGEPFAVKAGPITVDGFGNNRYPAITAQNLAFSSGKAQVSLASVTMKGVDLSAPIALVQSAAKPLTEEWFTANTRKLLPAFAGFAVSGVKIDVPDAEDGTPVKAGLGDFDLTLGDYTDGVPMRISSAAHHVTFEVPPASADKSDEFAELREFGITHLDVGYDLALHYDAASQGLMLDKLGVEGADLGSAVIAAALGNVDGVLFAKDTDAATAAAMAMTFKSASLDLTDAGLGDIIFKLVGEQQNLDPAQARTAIANMAQGVVLAGLASNPDARALGQAIGEFLSAAGKSLNVVVTAKDPAGIAMSAFAAAADDPQTLGSAVKISASAK